MGLPPRLNESDEWKTSDSRRGKSKYGAEVREKLRKKKVREI